nr:hypothetical protein BaRGS_006010 [Batillaria attramentaria]
MFSYDIWRGECRVDVILKHDVTSTVPDGVVFYGRKEGNCPVTKGYSLTTAGGQTACLRVYLAHTLPAEAEEKCGQDGSHMYRVENEEKKAIMTKHVHERDYPLTFYWIDGRRQSSGSYTFVLGNGATVSAGSSLWSAYNKLDDK